MRKENKKSNNKKLKFFKGIILVTVLTASLIITQPIFTVNTLAAAIEDCDLDGYDDHTGNPVPWIGFDSTKGEEIPAGWDGTTYKSKKAFEDSLKKDTDEDSNSSNNSQVSSSSTSSSKTTSSSSKSSSKSTNSSSKNSSKSTSSSSKSNAKSTSNSSKISSSDKSSGSVNSKDTNVEKVTVAENVEETTATDEEKKVSKKSKKKKSEEESTEAIENVTEAAEIVLLSQKQQIVSESVEDEPVVADTFLKAFTVGFTTDNAGLIPGLLILAGLFVAGVLTLIFGNLFGKNK